MTNIDSSWGGHYGQSIQYDLWCNYLEASMISTVNTVTWSIQA